MLYYSHSTDSVILDINVYIPQYTRYVMLCYLFIYLFCVFVGRPSIHDDNSNAIVRRGSRGNIHSDGHTSELNSSLIDIDSTDPIVKSTDMPEEFISHAIQCATKAVQDAREAGKL